MRLNQRVTRVQRHTLNRHHYQHPRSFIYQTAGNLLDGAQVYGGTKLIPLSLNIQSHLKGSQE